MLELYHDPISASSQKVRLVLAELRVEWTDRRISLLAGEQNSPEYHAINSRGEVPVLLHDGWTLTESSVISGYLVDAFAPGSLIPSEPQAQARVRYWMYRISDELHEACGVLSYAIAVRPMQLTQDPETVLATIGRMPDPVKRDRRREIYERGLDSPHFPVALRRHVEMLRELDAQLADRAWIAGPDVSLADTTALPYVQRLESLSLWPLVEPFPHVERWYEAFRGRPSYAAAITAFVPEAIAEVSRKAGTAAWPRVREILAQW